jgi:hypothetical protein
VSSVDIDINLVTKQALSGINNLNKQVVKSNSIFGNLRMTIIAANQAAELAGKIWRMFSGSIKDVINAAGIQQKAMNDLKFAFQSAGDESGEAADKFALFAAELQKVTTFGDEVTISAAALFTQLTKVTGEGLEQATIAGQNLAATLGISLENAMRMLAKASEDGGSSLRRYGVNVKVGATEAETLANAVNAVNNVMGGKAQAEMNTFIGLQKALSNAWGDLKEQVGFAIIENELIIKVMQNLVTHIQAIPAYISIMNTWIADNVEHLQNMGMALGAAGAVLVAYMAWVNKATIATYALAAAKKVLLVTMGLLLSPLTLIVAAIGALSTGVFMLSKHWDYVSANMKVFAGNMLSYVLPVIDWVLKAISTLVGVFDSELARTINEQSELLKMLSEDLVEEGEIELEIIREQNELKLQQEEEFQKELNEIKTDAYKVDAAAFEDANKTKEINYNSFAESMKKSITDLEKYEHATDKQRVQNFQSTMNSISTLARTENRALAAIGKTAAITNATIDGIAAVQKALASAPPQISFGLAALVGAAAAANVAKIAGVPLAEGGVVMPRAGGVPATIAEAGKAEAVIPLDDDRARRELAGIGGVNIVIQGNVIGDDEHIEELARRLSDAVQYRNIELRATA